MKKSILSLFLLAISSILIQAAELQVLVMDRDLEIPMEGAVMQILGQNETFISDIDGKSRILYPDELQRVVLLVIYPGYDSQRLTISSNQQIEIKMVISGMIEGEELVVERNIKGKSDEESGISVVMDKEDMNVTANLGIVEDVMNTVKTLPGVGYTSGWDAQPSIRGGYPEEMAATMDGFYVTYPFHWGGAYSIFNPNMVETAKLSHGVYSARYGRAMSGLLEVTTINTDEPELRFDGSLSTTSTDFFVQSPLGGKAGLFAGGKVTYLDTAKILFPEETESITTMPYIRDFYSKLTYKPTSAVKLHMSGFYGTDGVGMDSNFESDSYSTDVLFDYDYINAFLSGGMDWSPGEKLHIDVLGGYNWNLMDMKFKAVNRGTMLYSDDFLTEYGSYYGLNEGDSYQIDGLENYGTSHTDMRQGQLKVTVERLLDDSDILAVGTESVLATTSETDDFSLWVPVESADSLGLNQMNFITDVDRNHSLNTAGFVLWEHGDDSSRLKSELGIRGEFYTIWNKDFRMNALPLVNPRGSVSYSLLKDRDHLDEVNLSFGTGLFSYMPMVAELLEKEFGTEDWKMSPDRALFNVAGIEIHWNDRWKFKFETYYKYYLNRLILSSDDNSDDSLVYYNTDGKGHTAGFDFMLQKKIARRWDGYISYSFIWARFYNPSNLGSDTESLFLPGGEPLDRWYYPYYHRFHNLNMVINWRFKPGWTFSVIGQLASGAPRRRWEM